MKDISEIRKMIEKNGGNSIQVFDNDGKIAGFFCTRKSPTTNQNPKVEKTAEQFAKERLKLISKRIIIPTND
ncbi:MAG: hypothetical protein KA100_06890 [Rickettsiales bacterium]|nr:hypothetical protein [Rickettsiales bacterium]